MKCIRCGSEDLYYDDACAADECIDCGQWQDEPVPGMMTDEQCVAAFKEDVMPSVVEKHGADDAIALREAYNNYTDALCKDGRITPQQYHEQDNPF